jgi:hypothetical protein
MPRYPKNGTEDELDNWAGEVLDRVGEAECVALDHCGWQIVLKNKEDNPYHKGWPFNDPKKLYPRASWCEWGRLKAH